MKAELVNPFIESLSDIFTSVLPTELKRGQMTVSNEDSHPHDLTAVIGIVGESAGTVGLSFPRETALKMVSGLLGTEHTELNQAVIDGVSKLVRLVAGGAKAKLSGEGGTPLSLSLPNVIIGNSYIIEYPSGAMWIEVPFESHFGEIMLRVNFQEGGLA